MQISSNTIPEKRSGLEKQVQNNVKNADKNSNITNLKADENLVNSNEPFYNFLKNKWYFDELYQYIFVNFSKKIGMFFWKKIDLDVIDKFGPDGISNLIKKFSLKAVKFQSGFIYQYAFVMLIGFSIFLTLLIIN